VLAALESFDRTMENITSVGSSAWLKVENAKNNTAQTELLVTQHRNELLQYHARLVDRQRDMDSTLKRLIDQVATMLKAK
jgi:hypothetical protein